MAKGKTQTVTVKLDNQQAKTVSKTIELIVKGEQLVPDTSETETGVNTRTM